MSVESLKILPWDSQAGNEFVRFLGRSQLSIFDLTSFSAFFLDLPGGRPTLGFLEKLCLFPPSSVALTSKSVGATKGYRRKALAVTSVEKMLFF